MTALMDINRLRTLADAYGGDPACWPLEERAAAEALAAQDAEAALILSEAAALDALLDADPAPVPSEALMARVLADAADSAPIAQPDFRPSPRKRGFSLRLSDWLPGAALAGAAAAGVIIGLATTSAETALQGVGALEAPYAQTASMQDLDDYEDPFAAMEGWLDG